MNCIRKDIIQKYIDGEATPGEMALVNEHSKDCEKCAQQITYQKKMAAGIKKSIDLLAEDAKDIPTLKTTDTTAGKSHFLTLRRIIYSISAACLLLFFIVICHKENVSVIPNQVTIVHCLGSDIDANRPVTEQPIVIHVIDANGNVTEYPEK